ncbi:MAG: DUF1289 domain-containing protein [Gammaproteobacteria bacterium]|nr:MAG: DUF1289 domain-containing protein [Gammaproteobacteria bacterium]
MTSPCVPHRKKDPLDPCIRQCCLDDREVCVGCKRPLKVILDWHRMTREARQRWLAGQTS